MTSYIEITRNKHQEPTDYLQQSYGGLSPPLCGIHGWLRARSHNLSRGSRLIGGGGGMLESSSRDLPFEKLIQLVVGTLQDVSTVTRLQRPH